MFENTQTKELIVVFRGTNSVGNAILDLKIFLGFAMKIVKDFDKQIDKFQEKVGRNINTFVGHSAGGYFATKCKFDWKVHRITFNGLKCKNRDRNLNMRLPGDIISGNILSDRKNYIVIGRSMFNRSNHKHGIADCKKAIKDKDWNDIFKDRFLPRQFVNNSTFDSSHVRSTGWKKKQYSYKDSCSKRKNGFQMDENTFNK